MAEPKARDEPQLVLVTPPNKMFVPFLADFVHRAASLGLHVRTEDVRDGDQVIAVKAVAG